MPNMNSEALSHIRIGAACTRPASSGGQSSSSSSTYLTTPLTNLKSVFSFEKKSLNVTAIPSSALDTVWDPSTCLQGQMSSCFVLHDVITDVQARLLYELGPNHYYINWLDIVELNDLKAKFLFHYDAKCVKDLTCVDLSASRLNGRFSGAVASCANFKESLNAIGSIQVRFLLNTFLLALAEYKYFIIKFKL